MYAPDEDKAGSKIKKFLRQDQWNAEQIACGNEERVA